MNQDLGGITNRSIERFLDSKIPENSMQSLQVMLENNGGDNIRETSGVEIPRWDLPINISQQCLSH